MRRLLFVSCLLAFAAFTSLHAKPADKGEAKKQPEKQPEKQDEDKTRGMPPVFGASVSVVSVPVFVADRNGSAVRGLQVEDFELYDDGQRVPVVSFRYVDTTSPEEQAQIRQSPAARRRFLLLFDLTFGDLGGLQRARIAALDFVRRRLAESDLASVATFDANRGVRIVANFTEDRGLLAHAIETLGVSSFARINDPLGLAASLGLTDEEIGARRVSEEQTSAVTAALRVFARQLRAAEESVYRQQVFSLVGSMEELGRSLRGVEGRKQVIYFSTGFDSKTLSGVSGSEMRTDSEAIVDGRIWEVDSLSRYGDSRLRERFAEMTRTLSSGDCVVHSVEVSAQGRGDDVTRTVVNQDPTRTVPGRESLSFIASETGGRLFKDSNDLSLALGEVLDMTSRYYILGYQPEDLKGPGQFHKLKVKVQRKGAKLSHRAGYYEHVPRTAQTRLQRQFEAAQLVMTGAGVADLHFAALALPFPAPGDRQTLGVVVQVPREQIRWQKGHQSALELYGYAVALDGTVLDNLAQFARMDPDRADPKDQLQGLSFFGTFSLPPGQYTLRLMVQEPESGSAGIRFIDVTIPPHDPALGVLLPPVVMDDPTLWLSIETTSREGAPKAPFTVGGKPFLPRATFEVRNGAPEKLVLIAYEPETRGNPDAGIQIESSVTDRSGTVFPGGPLRIEKVHREEGGRRTYVIRYTPEGLPPGDYTLRIGIGEAGSRIESYSLLRVKAGAAVAGAGR
jgi:VWFA-related protein